MLTYRAKENDMHSQFTVFVIDEDDKCCQRYAWSIMSLIWVTSWVIPKEIVLTPSYSSVFCLSDFSSPPLPLFCKKNAWIV